MTSSRLTHSAYPVGMICTVGRAIFSNKPGTLAVVYENYCLSAEHSGVSLIFPNGNYDGFTARTAVNCMNILNP